MFGISAGVVVGVLFVAILHISTSPLASSSSNATSLARELQSMSALTALGFGHLRHAVAGTVLIAKDKALAGGGQQLPAIVAKGTSLDCRCHLYCRKGARW